MTSAPPALDPTRRAATLVPLRERAGALEVLLTLRPEHMRFMGGAAVFPGGAVAPADHDERWRAASRRSAAEAAGLLEEDETAALSSFVCALRESFEEVGLLLADGPTDPLDRADSDDPARFLERCLELGVVLRTDLLVPGGRWVTPMGSPIRFDTRFFLVRVPEGWEPEPDPREVAGCRWVAPREALEELGRGELMMAPPTIEMLQRLAAHATYDEAVGSLRVEGVGGGKILKARLSPLVTVVLAPNPGVMTGPGTNTYIVGSGPTVVIDPAVDDEEYIGTVADAAGDVVQILITHRHEDHVGGVAALQRRTGAPVRAWGGADAGGIPVRPLSEGEVIGAGTARLRTMHAPGHASDHVVFLLEETKSLFAGDNVLGEGTAVIAPPDGNMGDYLATLERLRDLHLERLFTGHFRPLDGGRTVIEKYIEHRRARERAILEVLREGPASIEGIVERVYVDVSPSLHPIARFSVQAHLELLEQRGEVRSRGDRWKGEKTID
jgi:glyoxylase-like metal-dependent hydrolase (beta-lactamase superfamily II)/8-oxo-dGTP pyrophosphatase MutT (NUDIX family)